VRVVRGGATSQRRTATAPARDSSDLEPLVLEDPMARRAIADFINADKNESGTLTADGAAPALLYRLC
jgi:hypothetical protein